MAYPGSRQSCGSAESGGGDIARAIHWPARAVRDSIGSSCAEPDVAKSATSPSPSPSPAGWRRANRATKGRSVYCWQRMVVLVGCAFVRFVSYTSVGGPQGRDIRLGNDRQRLKRVTFHHDPPRKRGGNRRLQDSAGRGRTADVSTSEVSRSRRSAPCTTDTRRHRELSIA